jgi:hypothetical protein
MHKIVLVTSLLSLGTCGLALADSITGGSTGTVVTSINDGTVTATGNFNGQTSIGGGGKGNTISVSAAGAAASVQILKDVPDPTVPTSDSTIVVNSVAAANTGTVTATGTFNGASITGGGTSNGMSVSAAGTSVSLSIIKR